MNYLNSTVKSIIRRSCLCSSIGIFVNQFSRNNFGTLAITIHSSPSNTLSIQQYHTSSPRYSKATKKGKQDDTTVEIAIPEAKDFESPMEKRISRLGDEFSKLRGGRVSSDMFNHIQIEAYGSRISLAEAAQVTVTRGSNKLNITPFDAQLLGDIATCIRDSGMSLNPIASGNSLTIAVPKPSKEARELLVKNAAKFSEKCKQELRQVRKDAMDSIKKVKSSISEDDTKRFSKEIDVLTEKMISKVEKVLKEKEKELLSEQ